MRSVILVVVFALFISLLSYVEVSSLDCDTTTNVGDYFENCVDGYSGSFEDRRRFAEERGIEDYTGDADQNIALLDALQGDESSDYYDVVHASDADEEIMVDEAMDLLDEADGDSASEEPSPDALPTRPGQEFQPDVPEGSENMAWDNEDNEWVYYRTNEDGELEYASESSDNEWTASSHDSFEDLPGDRFLYGSDAPAEEDDESLMDKYFDTDGWRARREDRIESPGDFRNFARDLYGIVELAQLIPGYRDHVENRRQEHMRWRHEKMEDWPWGLGMIMFGSDALVQECVASQWLDNWWAAGVDSRDFDPDRGTVCKSDVCVRYTAEYIDFGKDYPGDRYMYLLSWMVAPPQDDDGSWVYDVYIDGHKLYEGKEVEYGSVHNYMGDRAVPETSDNLYETFELRFTSGNPRSYVRTFGVGTGSTFSTDISSAEDIYDAHSHDYEEIDIDDDDDPAENYNSLP